MLQDSHTVQCPYCNWNNEAVKKDKLHPNCSTKKPKETDDVISDTIDCRNPKCMKPFEIFHFKAKGGIDFLK